MRDRRKWIILSMLTATGLALIHYAVRFYFPTFSVLYDGPPRSGWIPIAIDGEFLLHLLYFGGLISVTGRSFPSLNKPKYSDDGTESLFTTGPITEHTDWLSISFAWGFVPIYLLLWMLAYGYL
jgi:hypothetical protein